MSSLIEKISEINDCVSLINEDLKIISEKLKDFSDEVTDEVKDDNKCYLCDRIKGRNIVISYDGNPMYFEPNFCPNCGRNLLIMSHMVNIKTDKKCMTCKYHIVNSRGKISCNNNSGLGKINDKSYCSFWEEEKDED